MIERKCPFCGLILSNGGRHIYTCKENKENLTKEEIKLRFLQYNFGENILNDICNDYKKLYSLPMLQKKYKGIDNKSIIFLLNLNNIPIRSISESANKISKEKFKQTCFKKWGVTNPSQAQEIKDKKSLTFLKHYGVDNIWKLSDYNKKCAELHPETHLIHIQKLYNGRDKFWDELTKEELELYLEKRYKTLDKNGIYSSRLENKLCEVLNELNISYTRQYKISGNTHPYDFYLCNTKIIIEVNGNFWHANPKYYSKNDIIYQPGRKIKAKQIWDKDKKYIDYAANNGYYIIILWEDDFNENLKYKLINKLKNI